MAVAQTSTIDPQSPTYRKLRDQAVQYEGVFLNTLMKEMLSSAKTDGTEFGGGYAEDTWRGMQAEQFADAMARQGGIGLADQLMPVLLKLQEAQSTNQAGATP
jgi:flagellar protein FlgJ